MLITDPPIWTTPQSRPPPWSKDALDNPDDVAIKAAALDVSKDALDALDDDVIKASALDALDVPQDQTTATTSTGVTLYLD